MSCHNIGHGMNSVVKVILKMYDNGELDLPKAKKLIRACRVGVNWCDGNEGEAIECMRETRCNKCLRPFENDEKVVDMLYTDIWNEAWGEHDHRKQVFEDKYDLVGFNLCRSCSDETLASMKESPDANKASD